MRYPVGRAVMGVAVSKADAHRKGRNCFRYGLTTLHSQFRRPHDSGGAPLLVHIGVLRLLRCGPIDMDDDLDLFLWGWRCLFER